VGWHGFDSSRVPGRAASEPPHGQRRPDDQAVHLQRLHRVLTAAGVEATGRRQGGGDPPLVPADQQDQRPGQRRYPPSAALGSLSAARWSAHRRPAPFIAPRSARSRSLPSRRESASAAAGSARTTTSVPAGRPSSRGRMRWRSRRVTRWRTTEPPTALLTTNPARARAAVDASCLEWLTEGSNTCTTTRLRRALRPVRITVAKSSPRVSRAAGGSTADRARSGRQLLPALAPTSGQDGPAGPGAHTEPEAVGTRTTTVVGLKRTLALGHFSILPFSPQGSAVDWAHGDWLRTPGPGNRGAQRPADRMPQRADSRRGCHQRTQRPFGWSNRVHRGVAGGRTTRSGSSACPDGPPACSFCAQHPTASYRARPAS